MLKNYIRLAWRNLWKNKLLSLVNVLGFSAGMAFVLLIGAFIWSEFQVNSIVRNNERVFMVRSKWKQQGMGLDFTSPAPVAKALHDQYPQLVSDYYHHDGISSIVSKGDKQFTESLQPGDSTFLTLFGFPMLYGDARTALNKPNALVLTEAKAMRYFGKTDVIGQTLTIRSFSGQQQDFEITGVLKDLPFNTVTGYSEPNNEIFLPAASLHFFGRDYGFTSWENLFVVSYVHLKDGVHPEQVEQAMAQLLKQNVSEDVQKNIQLTVTPLSDYYFESNNGIARRMISILGLAALFILLMAVINFINISTGSSLSRLREVGVRKVMGGSARQMVAMFLGESVLLTAFTLVFALVLYELARPFFSAAIGKELPLLSEFPAAFAVLVIVAIFGIGLLAGLYPAFVLSRQASAEALKGKLKTTGGKQFFRYALITVQLVTTIVVLIAAVIIHQQVSFFFHTDLGYDKEQIVTATLPRNWSHEGVRRMEAARDEFARLPEARAASFSFEIPDGKSGSSVNKLSRVSENGAVSVNAQSMTTDEKFCETYGIPLAAGNFFRTGVVDTTAIVLNETAVKQLGWKTAADALGQTVALEERGGRYRVSGVVRDFHFGTMQQTISPLFFLPVQTQLVYRYLSVKLKPGNVDQSIAALEKQWKSYFPDAPFNYAFMDDTLSKLYKTEIQMKKASELATLVALLITLLGVFSIVTLNVSKRTKEVSIRKVLGASRQQIMLLFAKEFAVLFLLANLVAWPLVYFIMQQWLGNYAYHVELRLWPFAGVAVALAVLISMLIMIRTIAAARINPVRALNTE